MTMPITPEEEKCCVQDEHKEIEDLDIFSESYSLRDYKTLEDEEELLFKEKDKENDYEDNIWEKYHDLGERIKDERRRWDNWHEIWENNGYKNLPIDALDLNGDFNWEDYEKIRTFESDWENIDLSGREELNSLDEFTLRYDNHRIDRILNAHFSMVIRDVNSLSEEFDNWQIELEKKRTEKWYNQPLNKKEEDRLKKQLFTNIVELKEIGEKILKELKEINENLNK